MPSASDYRAAARRVRRLAEQLACEAPVLAAATVPADIAGGPVRWALERSARDVVSCIDRAMAELERLATVCELRAESCERVCADDAVELLRERGLTGSGPRP